MQTIIVDMTPGFRMPTIYYSQGDVGTQFAIDLRSRFGDSLPASPTVTIQATKPSGFGFSVAADAITNGVATFTMTSEMSDEAGRFPAELKVVKNSVTLFTANFYMQGEATTHPEGTTDGSAETIIPELTQLVDRAETAANSVNDRVTVTTTLAAGSDATYTYDEDTNTQTFGIPRGADGSLASGVLAPTYSASATYAVGDYVYYSGNLYRCTTAITTAEAWTSGHWTQVALAPEVSDLKDDIADVQDVELHSLSPTFVQGKGIDTYGYFQDSANRIATQEYVYVGDCEELIYDVADGYRLSIAFYSAQAVSGFVSVRYWLTGKNRLTCEGDYIRITEAHLNDSPAMTLTDASNIKISKNYPLCETFKNVQSDISDFKTLYYKHNFEITAQSSNQFFQIDGKIGDTFKFTNNTSGNVSIYLINSSGVQTSVPSATPLSSNTSVSYTLVSDAVKMKIYAAQLGTLTVETTNSLFNRLVEEVEKPIYKTILQADMTDGICVQSNGQIVSNENYVSIKNVPVIPKQKVYMTAYFGGGANASGGLSGWDANGNFKKRVFDGEINGNPTTDRTQYINKEVIIPDGVFYLGFSSRKDGTSTLKLEIMSVKNTTDIVDGAVAKHDGLGPRNIDDGTVFEAEVKSSIEATQTVLASSGKPMLTMAVFTDLHHDPKYANDPTIDMMANIKAINDRLHFDAIMNLGDAIDGQYQTQYEAEGCLSEVVTDMYSISDRSHNLMGNHDDNVQSTWDSRGGEPASEQLTLLEINDALFKGSPNEVHNPNHITDYYMDYDEYNIRVICVGVNYTSYVSATQTWLTNVALQTDKNVLVYSHCATKPEWGYLNDISNGSYIETPLNNFIANGGTVIALIHGHTHGDMIETDASINFTEVAIGCAKFETPTSGTVGITYQPRDADDYTKILFDIVCVDQTNREVHFIRCGAGSDRYISY